MMMFIITSGPSSKLCAWGRRTVEDMCYDIRRTEACVDKSDHHALVNAWGCDDATAVDVEVDLNATALAAASPTLLFGL